MNGQPQQRPEPEKVDVKKELERSKIALHNAKFQVQMLETDVKKLEELVKELK